jgi:hypothetical protein
LVGVGLLGLKIPHRPDLHVEANGGVWIGCGGCRQKRFQEYWWVEQQYQSSGPFALEKVPILRVGKGVTPFWEQKVGSWGMGHFCVVKAGAMFWWLTLGTPESCGQSLPFFVPGEKQVDSPNSKFGMLLALLFSWDAHLQLSVLFP